MISTTNLKPINPKPTTEKPTLPETEDEPGGTLL